MILIIISLIVLSIFSLQGAKSAPVRSTSYTNTNHDFYVPVKGYTFTFRPSNQKEAIKVYAHTKEWDYVLYNPFTSTLKWRFQNGKVNKAAAYYDNNCDLYVIDSIEYKQANCEHFLFSGTIQAKNAITITNETPYIDNEMKLKLMHEALQEGEVHF